MTSSHKAVAVRILVVPLAYAQQDRLPLLPMVVGAVRLGSSRTRLPDIVIILEKMYDAFSYRRA